MPQIQQADHGVRESCQVLHACKHACSHDDKTHTRVNQQDIPGPYAVRSARRSTTMAEKALGELGHRDGEKRWGAGKDPGYTGNPLTA